ncbi:NACHT domain-containing protein [Micromonospora sp. NPDC049051]|uniref:NACHT domain-containing protein n=1 Tax=Micromonospora sp. NPDC049051 TaxID=3364264 RepID=UPI00371E52C7
MDRAAAWLETGDQIASMVGAAAGVTALLVAIRAELRARGATGRRRRMPWSLLTLCVALFALRFVPAMPAWLVEPSAWAASAVGAAALMVAVRRGPSGPTLVVNPQIMGLMRRLKDDAARHRYRFFVGWSAPALSDVYVRQRPAVGGVSGGQHRALVSVDDLLTRDGHGLLLGGAGSGKSTLAATVTAAIASRALTAGDFGALAISVTAADLVGRSLPEALSLSCARDLGITADAELFAEPPVPGGRWHVIVDGVDEVVNAHDRSRLLWELRSLLREGDVTHRFLVTSRPLPDAELATLRSTRVTEYELRPFDRADLADFARRWFTARLPHDPEAAAREAALFLTRVTGARLGPVARVPLLATIAAMVYEQADGGALPASRAHLYARFVEHLLDGRHELSEAKASLVDALQGRGRAGLAIATWLKDEFYDVIARMLDAVGVARIARPNADLCAAALACLDSNAPHRLTDTVPDARRQIEDLLRSTGLFGMRHGQLAFLHQSFAEFLCARAMADSFDAARWRVMAANPAARSLAAFAAARRPDADTMVRSLVADKGIITAADMIADGVPVDDPTRATVLDGLFAHLGDDTPTAPEALRVLRELSVEQDVLRRLTTMAGDNDVPEWTRVVLADVVIDVDRPVGVAQLRHAGEHFASEPATWAADALRARGLQVDPRTKNLFGPPSGRDRGALGGLGRQALSQQAGNPDFSDMQRLGAAERLAHDGDLIPLRALVEEAGMGRLVQLAGGKILADLGDLEPLVTMTARQERTADTGSDWLQYLAAAEVCARDPARGVPILRAVFDRHEPLPRTYGCAVRLAEAGSITELASLAAADATEFWREPVSQLPWLQSPTVGANLSRAAARRLAGEPRLAKRWGYETGAWAHVRAAAAKGRDALHDLAVRGRPKPRLQAATWLGRHFSDPEELERVVADPGVPARFRVAAATSLAMLFGSATDEPLRQLERLGELHYETVCGIPATPIQYTSSIPTVPERSFDLCAALAADPDTPRSLRAALTLLLPFGDSADRLARIADNPAMSFLVRFEAINALVGSSPDWGRRSLSAVVRNRDLPNPLIWFLLLKIFLSWHLDVNRLGWREFKTIARRVEVIRNAPSLLHRLWRIAGTVVFSRPALDRVVSDRP